MFFDTGVWGPLVASWDLLGLGGAFDEAVRIKLLILASWAPSDLMGPLQASWGLLVLRAGGPCEEAVRIKMLIVSSRDPSDLLGPPGASWGLLGPPRAPSAAPEGPKRAQGPRAQTL